MRKRPFLLLATEFLLGIVCVREQLPAWGVLAVLLLVYTTPWKERGMRKVLFAAGLPGMFLLGMLQMQRQIDFRQQYLQKLTDGQEVRLAGKIDRIEPKTRCVYYYLKDCTVEAESQTLPCNDVIAYVSSASHSAGQILNIEGTISLFTEASNEGMFDARQFYQSQKIDFGIWVTKISRVYGKPDRYRCALQNMKKRANDVIRHSIRDDGVLSAMLLGEKGALDAEIKSLYQRAGIAHVLAISGLHISLLGMGLYRLLRKRLHTRYVTAALAIMSMCLIEFSGIRKNGFKHWAAHFAKPVPFVAPIMVLEIVIRPLSLCMRLFGNVLGAFVIMELLKAVAPVLIPIPFSFYFDIFDGFLQAYVFVFLTALFMNEEQE